MPDVCGCRVVDRGGPPSGGRSVPFNGPRHGRARNDIPVPYSAEESRLPNTSHITPLGRGRRPRPSNGLLPPELRGTESADKLVGTRVGQRAGVRAVAGSGGFPARSSRGRVVGVTASRSGPGRSRPAGRSVGQPRVSSGGTTNGGRVRFPSWGFLPPLPAGGPKTGAGIDQTPGDLRRGPRRAQQRHSESLRVAQPEGAA